MAKKINLALQGGGAHGAFTWGVLDAILECDELEIAGISGTSAGALNGAALKAGMVTGGRNGARANLAWLWARVLGVRDFKIATWLSPWAPATGQIARGLEATAGFGDFIAQATSPYSFGPFYRNPLDAIVHDLHFDDICCAEGPELHVCATNVRSGQDPRVLGRGRDAPCLDGLCLPADDLQGGGNRRRGLLGRWLHGNPALFPLYEPHLPDDVVIVNINPLVREDLPYTAQEIQNRINEISFNSSLLRDLRAIRFVQRLIEDGRLSEGSMSYINVHMIADDDLMRDLSVATKIVPSAILVERLFKAGRSAAERFIADHLDDVANVQRRSGGNVRLTAQGRYSAGELVFRLGRVLLVRVDQPGRNHEFRRVLHRHLQLDHLGSRHEQQEARCRVGRGGRNTAAFPSWVGWRPQSLHARRSRRRRSPTAPCAGIRSGPPCRNCCPTGQRPSRRSA